MDKKNMTIFLTVFIIVSAVTAVSVFSQDDVTKVHDPAFEILTRPPVSFIHDEHNEQAGLEDCTVCHHVYEDGKKLEDETSEDQTCSECHMKDNAKDPMPLIAAYHKMCKNCHLAEKKGPVMCAECHTKP